ncbi:Tex1 protein [Candida orthopsilosis Co 90-125]|uniref:Tex1 protein n=1 Tax=Candida orthopsilosis (strain 90-125) TaxID=1136231 RepID=H8X834_CANO9|nr:Tex1 protein [Candida orthopsilosis Co 90-125]CCG24133.1 Tex1 protein [Candida orthopsilosis Co 90-125]
MSQAETTIKHSRVYFQKLTPQVLRDKPLAGHTSSSSEVISISINNCGTRLVTSRTDKSLRIWKCLSDRMVDPTIVEDAHSKAVESISWDPNSEYNFATVGRDEYIKIWRGSTGTLENVIKTPLKSLKLIRYSIDGELMIVVDRESNVLCFAVNQNYKLVNEFKVSDYVYDLQWFNYGHEFFIIALHDGSLPIYKVIDSVDTAINIKLKATLTGHRSSATSIAISPRGRHFAIGASEGVVSIWDTKSMVNCRVITNIDEVVSSLDINRDGAYIAVSFDKDSNSIIYDLETGEELFQVPNSASGKMTFSSICWFPTKSAFAYSSDFGTTVTWMKKTDRDRSDINERGGGLGLNGPRRK